MPRFEYRVCQIQSSHVTFVNGRWQGSMPVVEDTDPDVAMASCPEIWDYLHVAGRQGWELIAASEGDPVGQRLQTVYLKRRLEP